jgi:biopolymer transport protein ExbD
MSQDPQMQERIRAAYRRVHKQSAHKTRLIKPAHSNTEINVTPLIDVVLVLLIIFMVLTPLKEADISVSVPTSEDAAEPSDVPPDQIVVYVDATGGTKLNTQKMAGPQLGEALKQKLSPKKSGDRIVFVVADDAVSYGKLVAVIDQAKQAGAETIGYATDAPDPAMFQ